MMGSSVRFRASAPRLPAHPGFCSHPTLAGDARLSRSWQTLPRKLCREHELVDGFGGCVALIGQYVSVEVRRYLDVRVPEVRARPCPARGRRGPQLRRCRAARGSATAAAGRCSARRQLRPRRLPRRSPWRRRHAPPLLCPRHGRSPLPSLLTGALPYQQDATRIGLLPADVEGAARVRCSCRLLRGRRAVGHSVPGAAK